MHSKLQEKLLTKVKNLNNKYKKNQKENVNSKLKRMREKH